MAAIGELDEDEGGLMLESRLDKMGGGARKEGVDVSGGGAFVAAFFPRVTSVTLDKPAAFNSVTRALRLVVPNASSWVLIELTAAMVETSTTKSTSTPATCVRRRRPAASLLTIRVMRTVTGLSARSLAIAAIKAVRSAAPKESSV
jgi:hypothetical protein